MGSSSVGVQSQKQTNKQKRRRKVWLLNVLLSAFTGLYSWELSEWRDGKAEASGFEVETREVMKAHVSPPDRAS